MRTSQALPFAPLAIAAAAAADASNASSLQRLATVLGHPLRIQVLALARDQDTFSVSSMAAATGVTVPRMAYHVGRLADAELLEIVGVPA